MIINLYQSGVSLNIIVQAAGLSTKQVEEILQINS